MAIFAVRFTNRPRWENIKRAKRITKWYDAQIRGLTVNAVIFDELHAWPGNDRPEMQDVPNRLEEK